MSNASVYNQLSKIVDLSALTQHTPFGQAIEILRNSTEPALNIVVLWRDLSENAFVEQDTPISMEGVSAIRLRTGLELLLRAVSSSPGDLGYVVQDGVIIVATKESLPRKMVTRIYDIRDLTAPPANYRFALPMGVWPGAFGIGRGWPGQGPIGPWGGAGGAYGRAARPTRRPALPYGSGWPSRRADEVAGLITSTIAPRSWLAPASPDARRGSGR
ncbi:MAG: hypothetical protein ACE5NM_04945 [Sedimentisphaerales bacterium]